MPQIVESRFRVLEVNSEDINLSDLEAGPPVLVETEDESYDEELLATIEELEPGNVVEAEIRSEDLVHQDGYWAFLTLDVVDRTKFQFIDEASAHPIIVDELKDALQAVDDNSVRKFIRLNGDRIGYLTVAETQGGDLWTGIQAGTRSHEVDLDTLGDIEDPPHEIIYTRTPDEGYLVFYHLARQNTDLAAHLVRANT